MMSFKIWHWCFVNRSKRFLIFVTVVVVVPVYDFFFLIGDDLGEIEARL